MSSRLLASVALAVGVATLSSPAYTQAPPDPSATLAAQRQAQTALARLDGTWRGQAWTLTPAGKKTVTQTERVGTTLDGTVRVIEGRGYEESGATVFQALGVVSFDPSTKAYTLRSYAMGRSGDFALRPTADGFTWEIPAGPATIRYTATISDSTWSEVGDRIVEGQPPFRFHEMTLTRLGVTAWPAEGAVPPR